MVICTQKDKFNWNGEEQMSENENVAKQEGPPVVKQPSVHLSVRKEDSAILEAVIDRTASQTAIIDDMRQELPRFDVPYRDVDPRILEAIRVKSAENLTFEQASIWVFGDPNFARKIRYWQNRWQLQ